ncbi:MAG: hypothetical protein HKO81_03415 [Flavobacteriaceae bacterium]|nr:hypothetical protein [Flavobacteriaceae bacterium]
MANLKTTILNSVHDIDDSYCLDINPEENTYFTKLFLEAFESSNPNIIFKYILVEKDEKTVALATIQIIELGIDVILKNIKLASWFKRIVNYFFCKDHIHIMFCGNIFLSGEHGIILAQNEDKEDAIKAIGTAIIELTKITKPLHAVFIKDFIEESRSLTDKFQDFGFTPMHVEPNMIIAIDPKWNSFDDYKNALKSKYRVKANKADKTSSSLEARLFSESDFARYKDELQQLYENTIANANFNAQVLNLNTYIKLRATYHEDFIVKAYFLNDKLVGFLSALANNHHLDAHFIGLDYALNKANAIYPRILNDYIRIGIEKKVSYINLGRTASEIKTTIGAVPTELTCYLKLKRPFINRFLMPFIKNVQIKDFKQHHPFKIEEEAK